MYVVLILFAPIFLYIFFFVFSLHKKSFHWYGEETILNAKKSYRAKFFSQSDILFVLLIVISGFLFYHIINLETQWINKIYLFIVAAISLFPSLFHFRLKYQFWQENRNREYVFDPIERKVLIIGEDLKIINLEDIEKITQILPKNNKLASSFIKIHLKKK